MIASRLAALGLPPRAIRLAIVATFALVSGLVAAAWPHSPFLAPVVAWLAAIGALVDPNAHAGA